MSGNALLILFGLLGVGGLFLYSVLRYLFRKRVPYWENEDLATDWFALLGVAESADLETIRDAFSEKLKAVPKLARRQENEVQRRAREEHLQALETAYRDARHAKFDQDA